MVSTGPCRSVAQTWRATAVIDMATTLCGSVRKLRSVQTGNLEAATMRRKRHNAQGVQTPGSQTLLHTRSYVSGKETILVR